MKNLQNLHTHTIYCDGQDTPADIVREAISRGFSGIGFSGHSYVPFSPSYCMSEEGTEEYKDTVFALRESYSDKIDIFCGIELDSHSEISLSGYDYVIGSAHFFDIDGEYVGFDRNEANVKEMIKDCFGEDSMKFAKAYYEHIASMPWCGKIDIIGHFDLAAKHSDRPGFMDINSREYLNYAFDAIDALRGSVPFFEINTGAMARGFRRTPYPSAAIIKRFLECGMKPIITSDCHKKSMLDFGFCMCDELLSSLGAKEKYILTKNGFAAVPI